jgi:hypothetical protein
MSQSRDYDELLHYWQAWHEAVGPPLKNKYVRYVQLANQAAKLNGKKKLHTFFINRSFVFRFLYSYRLKCKHIILLKKVFTPFYSLRFSSCKHILANFIAAPL